MSSTLTLFKSGAMDEEFFQTGAKTVHDFTQPNRNETVRNMINYYQLLQGVGELSQARGDYDHYREGPNNEALIHAIDSSDYPILIGIEIRENGEYYSGHALLAYDYKETSDGYDVAVWDPNHMNAPVNLHISSDFSTSAFTNNYDWERGRFSTFLKYSIPAEGLLSEFRNLQDGLEWMGHSSGYSLSANITAMTQQLILNTNYDSYTITSSTGASATIRHGVKTSGGLSVGAPDYLNEPGAEFDIDMPLPMLSAGQTYTITPSGDKPASGYRTALFNSVSNSGYFSSVVSEAAGSVTIAADGTATSDLANGAANLTVSVTSNAAKTTWQTVSATGSADTLTVSLSGPSGQSVKTDSSTTLAITASNLYNETTLRGTGSDFSVTEPETGKMRLEGGSATETSTLGYSAVFYTGGGSTVATQSNIQPGAKVTRPADPTRAGYTFEGWYTSPDYKTRYDFNAAVTEDLKLYAKWTEGAATTPSLTIYRLYNEATGEHLFTESANEYNVLPSKGWQQEGVAWQAPKSSATPVYRLHNPNNGDHHYTTNVGEYNALPKSGWTQEGVAFYSAASDGIPVYRLYNEHADTGIHHYTTKANEYNALPKSGWTQEGVGWYGLP